MRFQRLGVLLALLVAFASAPAHAESYSETINNFKRAGQSAAYFENSYGYAVFPTIGKGGIGVGGAHGSGHVYDHGKHVGNTSMTQVTVGFQFGGQAYSMMIFFQDKAAFERFTSGHFEFGAEATAVALTAGASAQATTGGSGAGASVDKDNATTAGSYQDGLAVFTLTKGGLMYEATIGGQKFSYKPLK